MSGFEAQAVEPPLRKRTWMVGDWRVDPEDRSTFYGATDIAAILGTSRWTSPIDVFLEKADKVKDTGSSWAQWGQRLEDAICDGYAKDYGHRVRRAPQRGIVPKGQPLCVFHPDRMVIGEPGVFDAKATERTHEYGDAGTDEVPARVRVQMVCYIGATGREWADVGVLPGSTRGLNVYRVMADPDLYEMCLQAVTEFHEQHVLADNPPGPDGSGSWTEYAAERWPQDDGSEMAPPTPEQMLLVDELREAFLANADTSRRLEAATQHVKDLMGEHAIMPTHYGAITWRTGKPRANPWKAHEHLDITDEEWQAALESTKAGKVGSRTLRHPFKDETE